MIEINKIKSPFIYYCQKVIPLAFDESLSYYEVLCNLTAKIKEVIDEQNNQGEGIIELQEKYLELKNYVDEYFENLNVQEEINNKLDEMAEGGELADIIAQYLGLAGVLAFNTVADMVAGENLTNGSICYCLGQLTYNDKKGSFYKVRTITSGDTVDGVNIIALDVSNTLIAEKIDNYDIEQLYNSVDEINDDIDLINSNDTIFLGDSYANGTTYEHGSVEYLTSWCEYLRQLMGLTTGHYYRFYKGNAGFSKLGNDDMNFKMTLESHLNDITDKNIIKNIVVCAGYNDYDQTLTDIKTKISEFITFCKTNFPNAQVYIGMIGGNTVDSEDGRNIRNKLLTVVLNAYSKCNEYGGIYLNGVELFTHNFEQFNSQGNHPNETGYKYVANMIYNALLHGSASIYEDVKSISLPTTWSNKNFNYQVILNNEIKTVFCDNFVIEGLSLTGSLNNLVIVPANTNGLIKTSIDGKTQITCDVYVNDSNNTKHHFIGKLEFKPNGSIILAATELIFMPSIKDLVIWGHTTDMPTMLS